VPAPTCIAGSARATASIAASAASLRSVISMTSMPPSSSASAIGTACAGSAITTTGTTREENFGSGAGGFVMAGFSPG
jgi:hypothetical protein